MIKSKQAFLLYLPVIQRGYLDWFNAYPEAKTIFILGNSILDEIDYLRKDIRALSPHQAAGLLNNIAQFERIEIAEREDLSNIASHYQLLMPEDDVTRELHEKYLQASNITMHPVFLRWHRDNVNTNATIENDSTIAHQDIPEEIRDQLHKQSVKSTDWWRHVGAVLAQEKTPLLVAHNAHLPTNYTPAIDGDMRMTLRRGAGIELAGSEHAEAGVLAQAAAQGIATAGLDLYTTDFPCPPCAKFIASAQIKNLYYIDGYAVGNGLEALKNADVTITQILGAPKRSSTLESRPYPTSHNT